MMILEAINSATNEHAVFFLVTAYIESLHHFHRSLGIPQAVISLPVAGVADLEERLSALRNNINEPAAGVVPVSEVSQVLASALERLGSCRSPSARASALHEQRETFHGFPP